MTEEYTRGGMDAPDARGKTMVELHNERLRLEKETTAMKIVRALVPDLTIAVCKAALEHCQLDGMEAAHMLQAFKKDRHHELHELHKTYAPEIQGNASSESDGSDSSADSRKKRKRSSKKKKSSKKHSKEDKKKRKKKHKRDASPGGVGMGGVGMGGAASQQQYGKYGIVKESDLENKRGDFMVWAIEVAKVDPEVLPKHEERELFKTYMEDYNTATLPHKKYYNVAAYEAKQRAKAASKGQDAQEQTRFDDEEEVRRQVAARRAKEQQERLQQAYDELVHTDKAADMREQQLLRAEMALAYRTGDHAKAERLALRLAPDEVQEKKKQQAKTGTGMVVAQPD